MGTDGDSFSEEIHFLKLHAVARLVNAWRLFKNVSLRVTLYMYTNLLISERFLTFQIMLMLSYSMQMAHKLATINYKNLDVRRPVSSFSLASLCVSNNAFCVMACYHS